MSLSNSTKGESPKYAGKGWAGRTSVGELVHSQPTCSVIHCSQVLGRTETGGVRADPALWEESLKHEHQVPCVQGTAWVTRHTWGRGGKRPLCARQRMCTRADVAAAFKKHNCGGGGGCTNKHVGIAFDRGLLKATASEGWRQASWKSHPSSGPSGPRQPG